VSNLVTANEKLTRSTSKSSKKKTPSLVETSSSESDDEDSETTRSRTLSESDSLGGQSNAPLEIAEEAVEAEQESRTDMQQEDVHPLHFEAPLETEGEEFETSADVAETQAEMDEPIVKTSSKHRGRKSKKHRLEESIDLEVANEPDETKMTSPSLTTATTTSGRASPTKSPSDRGGSSPAAVSAGRSPRKGKKPYHLIRTPVEDVKGTHAEAEEEEDPPVDE